MSIRSFLESLVSCYSFSRVTIRLKLGLMGYSTFAAIKTLVTARVIRSGAAFPSIATWTRNLSQIETAR